MKLIASDAVFVTYTDAEGVTGRLLLFNCPVHSGELLIALTNGSHPLHCSQLEAMQLVEALRAGEAWQGLKPATKEPGARVYMERMRGNPGAWMVMYRAAHPGVCFFVCHGADPHTSAAPHRLALTTEQRMKFSDAVFEVLMRGTARAGVSAQA